MLSPEEYEQVKAHVLHSIELVRAADALPAGVADIILAHHERQDGSGYPHGIGGDAIPIDGAIAALVDSFSALTSSRPYAEQASPSNALNLMHKLRGKLFHEALVEQFIQCIGIYPVGAVVELNTGEVAIVIAQNLVRRLAAARHDHPRSRMEADPSAEDPRPRQSAQDERGRAVSHLPHAAEGQAADRSQRVLPVGPGTREAKWRREAA
jgi:hypothetical protein